MLYNFILKIFFLFGYNKVDKKTCNACGKEIYFYGDEDQYHELEDGKVKCGKCNRVLEPVRQRRKN